MGPKAKRKPESVVKGIKRNTRRKFNSEEKIRIILEGLQGEDSIANICRKEGIVPSISGIDFVSEKLVLDDPGASGKHHFFVRCRLQMNFP